MLSQTELEAHVPDSRLLAYLAGSARESGLTPQETRVLDWGCGRGQSVLWLRDQGYCAFGVDVDPDPIAKARDLLRAENVDSDILRVVGENGETDFPTSFFHFVYSNQVFEHVADLDSVVAEIRRLTVPGGEGLHVYSAHLCPIEDHLFMPFVHWFPKNASRKYMILLCLLLGLGPGWPELDGVGIRARTARYYQYSVDKTYYRKPSQVAGAFKRNDFSVAFDTINDPRFETSRIFRLLRRAGAMESLMHSFLINAYRVAIRTRAS